MVSALLGAGACVDARQTDGGTPLIDAVSRGHKKVARVLLDAGADVGITGKFYTLHPTP